MSITSVQSMNNQTLRNINDKMLDNINLVSDIEQAVTLEELKGVFKYCFRYVNTRPPSPQLFSFRRLHETCT